MPNNTVSAQQGNTYIVRNLKVGVSKAGKTYGILRTNAGDIWMPGHMLRTYSADERERGERYARERIIGHTYVAYEETGFDGNTYIVLEENR